jgi:hypothetical protein
VEQDSTAASVSSQDLTGIQVSIANLEVFILPIPTNLPTV